MNLLLLLGLVASAHASSLSQSPSQPPSMQAIADGKGKVNVEIVYYAEDTCVELTQVREGHPDSIEAPKRSLVITATVERKQAARCEQKLKTLNHKIAITDRPGVRSVEIFFIGKDGKFIRSSKPRIYRNGEEEGTI